MRPNAGSKHREIELLAGIFDNPAHSHCGKWFRAAEDAVLNPPPCPMAAFGINHNDGDEGQYVFVMPPVEVPT